MPWTDVTFLANERSGMIFIHKWFNLIRKYYLMSLNLNMHFKFSGWLEFFSIRVVANSSNFMILLSTLFMSRWVTLHWGSSTFFHVLSRWSSYWNAIWSEWTISYQWPWWFAWSSESLGDFFHSREIFSPCTSFLAHGKVVSIYYFCIKMLFGKLIFRPWAMPVLSVGALE